MENKHENYEILNLLGYGLAKFNHSFIKEFNIKTKTSFYNLLVNHVSYKNEELLKIKPIVRSQFKQLQKTGLEAEMYFLNNYKNIDVFRSGIIEDARLLGDGYDFQIEVDNEYFLAEVKGVRSSKGAIRLTTNEYNKAYEYKDRYILSVISNLNDTPKITLVVDPLQELELNKMIINQEQTTYNTNSIIW